MKDKFRGGLKKPHSSRVSLKVFGSRCLLFSQFNFKVHSTDPHAHKRNSYFPKVGLGNCQKLCSSFLINKCFSNNIRLDNNNNVSGRSLWNIFHFHPPAWRLAITSIGYLSNIFSFNTTIILFLEDHKNPWVCRFWPNWTPNAVKFLPTLIWNTILHSCKSKCNISQEVKLITPQICISKVKKMKWHRLKQLQVITLYFHTCSFFCLVPDLCQSIRDTTK